MSPLNALRRARRGILVAVIATLVSIVSVLTYCQLHALHRPNSRGEWYDIASSVPEPSLSTMFGYPPTLLAVGDSSTAAYPFEVADKMGWSLARDVQNGTGFLRGVATASPPRVPFIDRLDGDAAN